MKVTIVIPNYNTWDLVNRNINACLKYDDLLIDEIIVVDDYSPTINYLNFDSRVKVIRNSNNLRYTKSVNIGLRAAKNELLVLLDSDAFPINSFLPQLIHLYIEDKKLGCVGFKTVDEHGLDTGNILHEPSILSLISGQKIHSLLRKYNLFESKNILPFSCAVSFRKSMLAEIGYFDELFPVLEADHEMSMRIYRTNKWKLIYDNSIEIFHKGGGSIALNSDRVILFYKYRWLLLKKFNKISIPLLVRFLIIIRLCLEFSLQFIGWLISGFRNSNFYDKIKGRAILIRMMSKKIS